MRRWWQWFAAKWHVLVSRFSRARRPPDAPKAAMDDQKNIYPLW